MKTLTNIAMAVAALFLALAVDGCSDGATLELKLMDAPAGVEHVNLLVGSIQAHVAGGAENDKGEGQPGEEQADPADSSIDNDGSWNTLEVNKTIDLMAHQGELNALSLGELSIPEGKITQLRLILDTSAPANNTVTVNGVACNLDITQMNANGIKINHAFKFIPAEAEDRVEITVDFDLDHSLVPSDSCFLLKPVLKLQRVKVNGEDQDVAAGN